MIIVSQDKYNVLNFSTTVNIGVEEISMLNDRIQMSAQTNGNTIVLGKYINKERAKEVLQEIVDLYRKCQQVIGERGGVVNYIYPPKVYEMPKE